MMFRRRSNIRIALYTLTVLLLVGFFLNLRSGVIEQDSPFSGDGDLKYQEDLGTYTATPKSRVGQKAFVVASQQTDDVDWLYTYFPDWEKFRYVVDDPKAELTVPRNKGRESMVYLTYIIENYENLPDYTLFLHPKRYQWHNDDPDYDGLPILRNFQLPYLEQEGYVNLRCAWQMGCPEEIKPYEKDDRETQQQGHAGNSYYRAFKEIFGEDAVVPDLVAISCCAQFALTRHKIRSIPLERYQHLRDWLANTDLEDRISGRVMEYAWHIFFGKDAVYCPVAKDCYCKVFGLCSLNCTGPGGCQGQYTLPPYSNLPEGWPLVGWDLQPRNRSVELDVPN
ncbi:hypothetical protein IWX90DRAFT_57766 [Phyllosticta citrichinensis]|uniref:Uncharacterized protein n=1 Tax=Phyllosticta citrichinensis TaxID=1130410 RepID=A0ABR1XGX1_9PEZI